ncbi:AAA family ATPase [Sphingobacterium sp. BN32]|uniref:AAA family ATPase n=1 Tax=Sphingobacterium sp. BN32 TaxID=3058432 RepID=UPI00265CCCF3|nr:AAA family ATPase [Sphingobacterium sp. BN32]WKK60350.1 hypothetical protein QYC40_08925 [Sphingobacterium sp. BN32]
MTTQNNNIKLSKIILEAFRGYRDRVTFDFTLPDNKIADIVAIYAPNGFGKTSFFDGIEWNTKGKIERFEENSKIKNSAEEFGGAILKNRESNLNNGSVSLFDQQNLHFTRITSSSDKWDLLPGRLDSNNTSPLKNIVNYKTHKRIEILPQSRIDSFLSSKTPEEKYQALLDFWDGNDESDYFVGVSKFYEESEKELVHITAEIGKISSKILGLTNSEGKILFFNSLIKQINFNKSNNIIIQEFTEDTTDSEFENTVREINNSIASVVSKLQQSESEKERMIALREGLSSYSQNIELVVSLNNEVKALQSVLSVFAQLENKQNEKKDLESKLQKEVINLEKINAIEILKNSFSSIIDETNRLTDERKKIVEDKIKFVEQKNTADKELKNKEDRLKSILVNESKFSENYERLAELMIAIETNKKKGDSSNNRLSLCKRIRETRNNIVTTLRTELNTVQNILSLSLESLCNIEYTYSDFSELVLKIKEEFYDIEADNKMLAGLRKEYNKKGSLNEDLQKIIELGKNFISNTETNTCPLCDTPQTDFKQLLFRISSQKDDALSLNQNYERIQSLQTGIEQRKYNINIQHEVLLSHLKQQSLELTESLTINSSKLSGTEGLINYYTSIETIVENENKRLNSQYSDIEIENDFLKLLLEDSDNLKQGLSQSITDAKKQIEDAGKRILETEHRVTEIVAKIEELNQRDDYITVDTFLQSESIIQAQYLESGLQEITNNTQGNIQKLRDQISFLKNQIDLLRKNTENSNKEDIQKNLIEKTTILKSTEDRVSQYKSQYKSLIEADDIKAEIIKLRLSTIEQSTSNLKERDIKLRELQNNIEFMQQNLELKKLRADFKFYKEKLENINETAEKLSKLKAELSDFLTQKIDSVFNQEIINDIYKKIDPHPDFKKIKLEPQFDGIKPKLFIKAVNEENQDEIDPILYLSSAQVNILSLSIFLAKALQNKDVMINTIFMDDPIQYLDSINVLSFIDLLRSITTDKQLDRQLVISTHDENFFNLLKKKFNPHYYNSKFIAFESYGKLEAN